MKIFVIRKLSVVALALLLLINGAALSLAQAITPQEARVIAKEAYIYGFPVVDNYRVMHASFVDRGGAAFKAPWNQIHNEARVFTPGDKVIQTPNSDTPYSQIGTDLRTEPLVITVPAVAKERYYSAQFIDFYTFNYAYIGSRATGSEAGSYLLAGPDWKGEKPREITAVIRSETQLGWVQFRTQLFDPGDIEGVKQVQAGYKVQPLSAFLGQPAPPPAPAIAFLKPLTREAQRTSVEFFRVLDFALRFCPTHPSEKELRARFAQLGLGTGTFDPAQLSPELRRAFEDGISEAWKEYEAYKRAQIDTGLRTAADGYGTREYVMKHGYIGRMTSAVLGIYGNSKEEASYPAYYGDAEGAPLDTSKHRYVLRFAPGQLPPVNSFWSLTMYEMPASLLYANPLDRYLINSSMLPGLKRDSDGGLTLHLQNESPGKEREANWLPAPKGPFFAVMRLYWPKEEVLNGQWQAPALKRVKSGTDVAVPVTVENFVRAETDTYFGAVVKKGGFGKFDPSRELAPLDGQTVIRLNRDTLYSSGIFDLGAGPVTITMPEAGKRFISMQVIDQNHYTYGVFYGAGSHTFTQEKVGTRYIVAAFRILVDPMTPGDLAAFHQLQDAIKVGQPNGPGTFEVPAWDPVSQKKVRDALLVLADTLPDKNRMFGKKGEVDPVRFLLGAASGWGGNPEKEAIYLNVTPAQNDGKTAYRLKVREVPVDAFWSVCVYNAQGYFEKNAANAYVVNNLTAKKDSDGSVTIQFGGEAGEAPNLLPIMPGWNYMVRLYRPRKELLDGTWKFPAAVAVK